MRTGTVANSHYISRNLVSSNALQVTDYLNIVVCLILLPSAIVHGLLGINEKTAFMILAPIIVMWALIVNRFVVNKTIFKMPISMVFIGVVGSLVASAYSQLFIGSTFAISIMAGYELRKTLQKPPALRAVTFFTLILLAGGVVGLLYSYLGKPPLLDVKVGYRTTHLYLTTFSFAQIGNFIRPSGIFDEPGAFAMYAALITIVNDLLNQNRYLNFAILTLMVFTGSIAGLIIIVLYLLLSNAIRYYRKGILSVISLLAVAYAFMIFVNPYSSLIKALDTFYTDRLQVVDGRLVGDNRSSQIVEFFDLVDEDIIIRGAKSASKKYGEYDQSSNPFSIVFGYGLIISLPYFALLLWLLAVTVKNRFHNSYASLGLFALLLQRPYLYNMMWSIMISAVIWLIYYDSCNRFLKQRENNRKLPPPAVVI